LLDYKLGNLQQKLLFGIDSLTYLGFRSKMIGQYLNSDDTKVNYHQIDHLNLSSPLKDSDSEDDDVTKETEQVRLTCITRELGQVKLYEIARYLE
jgi:hypothetical protein